MSKYIIHGKEVEYRERKASNMRLFVEEVDRLNKLAESSLLNVQEAPDIREVLRIYDTGLEAVQDAFYLLLGEGSVEAIFGDDMDDFEVLSNAWKQFVEDVNAVFDAKGNDASVTPSVPAPEPAPVPMNREQRRAAEREQRRREAAQRAAIGNAR